MLRRHRCGLASVALSILAALAAPPAASAGFAIYRWGPVVGYGSYFNTSTGQTTDFTTNDGDLSIGYDPDQILSSYIDINTGSPGYEVRTTGPLSISASSTEVLLSASYGTGGNVYVTLDGNPGPLNSDGNPESLNPLLDHPAYVTVTPAYHIELTFVGAAVPEPSSFASLAIGCGVASIACAMRSERRRP
jgi:hypothetical protein